DIVSFTSTTYIIQVQPRRTNKAILILINIIRYDIEVIVEAIKKEYGDNSVVTYYGDTSTDDRQKAITKIQDPNSPVRFIVGTPQTSSLRNTKRRSLFARLQEGLW
ncbi:MAG: hypothetical protein ACKOW3_08435, partial [Hyphomicrobium sp.]